MLPRDPQCLAPMCADVAIVQKSVGARQHGHSSRALATPIKHPTQAIEYGRAIGLRLQGLTYQLFGARQRALAADPDNKGLTATVAKFAPDISAPVPPPALEAAPRTSI